MLFFLFLLCCTCASAQVITGVVKEDSTGLPLNSVSIINITNNETTVSEVTGNYAIIAGEGDIVQFSLLGYEGVVIQVQKTNTQTNIVLSRKNVMLKEFILHPGLTAFQKDSIIKTRLYQTELDKKRIKPSLSNFDGGNGVGVGFNGVISSFAQKHSKKWKKTKNFQQIFNADMQQRFIDTRYKPDMVQSFTGFTGDTLVNFMNTYPMDYSFARAASDLELKMWIRGNFKDYKAKHPDLIDAGTKK